MILGLLVLRLTLTRRLKKKLKATGDYWDSGTIDFGFINTSLFAWVIPPISIVDLSPVQVQGLGADLVKGLHR